MANVKRYPKSQFFFPLPDSQITVGVSHVTLDGPTNYVEFDSPVYSVGGASTNATDSGVFDFYVSGNRNLVNIDSGERGSEVVLVTLQRNK